MDSIQYGYLAEKYCDVKLPLEVLLSGAGYYIGTSEDGAPFSRESKEYFPTEEAATQALNEGNWTQRPNP